MKSSLSHPRPGELFRNALERKKRKNPSYSLRSLAKRLDISHSYLSRVMKGEKSFPMAHFEKFAEALEMDPAARKLFKQSVAFESLSKRPEDAASIDALISSTSSKKDLRHLAAYKELTDRDFNVLEHWYYLPILDLSTCEDFKADPIWIADRLGLTKEKAASALERLKQEGLLTEKNGKLTKASEKIRFPTRRSHSSVRRYHKQMIQLAVQELLNRTEEKSFDERLIMGLSVAINPEKIQPAKERLNEALLEVIEILTDGPCSEVYQLNTQLFPLTRRKS